MIILAGENIRFYILFFISRDSDDEFRHRFEPIIEFSLLYGEHLLSLLETVRG